jgi:Tfp pilus assembly protein PilN
MIRINLIPAKRRRSARASAGPSRAASGGQWWLLGMLLGWAALCGVGWWLLDLEQTAEAKLRVQIAEKNKQIEVIKAEIDEEGLAARQRQVEQMESAIAKLNAERRSPVYVMYELGMILTDTTAGGGPDIDQEKYRQNVRADPQSQINDRWDPTGLWLTGIVESEGALTLEGQARDAADLTEFTRRLRASARFTNLSHPDFQRTGDARREGQARYLAWKLSVGIRRWD